MMKKLKIVLKNFLKKNFKNIYNILYIFINNIILRKDDNITFSGWGLQTTTALPWDNEVKNKISLEFKSHKSTLDKKIKNKEFYLAQISNYYENLTFEDVINHYETLTYRNYVVHYSSVTAFNNTKSRNVVECGSAEGLSIYFVIKNFIKDKNFKCYLYDSWDKMREKELVNEEDLKRKDNYSYLNVEIIKKNLKEFESFIIYNKGYIPEVFDKSVNPNSLAWLHLDLNSSYPTKESLKKFYPILEKNGVILFDDYGHTNFSKTRIEIEKFFKDEDCEFLQFMTGQAMVIKKH